MQSWSIYRENKRITNLSTKLAKILVREIGNTLYEFYHCQGSIRKYQTRCIKDRLAILGKKCLAGKPSYQVYTNGLSDCLQQKNGGDFKNSEWLWDMHWYVDGEVPYTTISLPLVIECEWNSKRKGDKKIRFSGIKYDFQKLLVTNACLRLMIFKIKNKNSLTELSDYFEKNISLYQNLPLGSAFLFVGFFDKEKIFYYREIIKK